MKTNFKKNPNWDPKKSGKANLEGYSKIFMLLGLVLALLVVYLAIEKKTYDRTIDESGKSTLVVEEDEQIIELKIKPPPPPKKEKQQVIMEVIQKVEDTEEIIETIIESTEIDEDTAVEIVEQIIEVEEEEVIVEDVPFAIIEDVPVYPGCKGNKAELRKCLQDKISKHVGKKFNSELALDLGLNEGIQRIFVIFKIDKYGNVTDIQARAPHRRLQTEAIRVIKLLPKMIPGKQRGKPVGVKYSLPIALKVE